MPISLFDLLIGRLLKPTQRKREDLSFLTHEEIRELMRMREEVRLAREQSRLFVTQGGARVL